MLKWYISECMVSIINITNSTKEPTRGYQYCKSIQNIDLWWVCQGERIFYTRVDIWIDTILIHVNSSTILYEYEGSCMVYILEWYPKQNIVKYPFPTIIKKMWHPHYRYPNGIQ